MNDLILACISVNNNPMTKRRRKRGRPRTGHDPMIGVRLPTAVLRKIDQLADALASDRSSAIRWIIKDALERGWSGHLLRNRKGRGLAGTIASLAIEDFRANEAAKHAARRRTPADRVQAQIKALRAAERADSSVYGLADRMALQAAQKRMAKRPELRSEAKIGTTTEAPSASSFEPVARDAGLGQEISSMPPLMRGRARKLSDVEVQAAVDRAVARSVKQR